MRAQDEGQINEPTNENPTNGSSAPRKPVSRRTLLAAAGGGAVLGAGLLGGGLSVSQLLGAQGDGSAARAATPTPSPSAKPKGPRRYVSTTVTAPQISVWQKEGTTPSPGLLFAAPRTRGFTGIIFDDTGEPVWIEPSGLNTADLRVQQYLGQPVLTYWSGTIIVDGGFGIGAGTILDTSYRPIATVRTGNGVSTDLHEFRLTPRGTALVMAYPVLPADLRPVNGPRDGWILGARVQEIDVATGNVLVDWDGLDDIELTETYQKVAKKGNGSGVSPETPFDPIHLNSVEADGESALLISARHTHALYSIDRTSAVLRWKLGGRASDFDVPEEAAFAWQHDARRQPDGRITLFDNHKKTGKGVSSGLSLIVDETAKTVTLDRRYTFRKHFGGAMGGTQVLPSGNVLVGWGLDPALTEFTADGTAIFDANLGGPSYRAYRDPWTGTPAAPPDIAVRPDEGGGIRVYMSWNGATGVAGWQVLSGQSATSLAPAGGVAREGFESSVVVPNAPWVQAQALDASGAVIGTSRPHNV
jgi:hypothetical protein